MGTRVLLDGDRKAVVMLETENERCPVEDALQSLRDSDFDKTMALLGFIGDHGTEPLDDRKSKKIKDCEGLIELRPTSQIRVLYCHAKGNQIVLLDVFRKQRTRDRRIQRRYKTAAKLVEQVRKCST